MPNNAPRPVYEHKPQQDEERWQVVGGLVVGSMWAISQSERRSQRTPQDELAKTRGGRQVGPTISFSLTRNSEQPWTIIAISQPRQGAAADLARLIESRSGENGDQATRSEHPMTGSRTTTGHRRALARRAK